MAKKTRNQLKDLFKPGAKPSGADFSDFIESTFNIQDDGLEKPVGADAPLKIISYGAEENLLDFYAGNAHSWRINLKPSATATAGLNFSKADGSSKLFIASNSGNVGISTTTPAARLHILQSGNADTLRIDDGESDNTPFLIDKNGNVGIGTDSPNEKLEVIGTVKATAFEGNGANITNLSASNIPNLPASKITSGTISGNRIASFSASKITSGKFPGPVYIQDNSNNGTWLNIENTSSNGREWNIVSTGSNNSEDVGSLLFRDNTNGAGVRMTIKNDGKVGIGTTSPEEKLHVDGDIRTDNAIINNGGQSDSDYAAFSHKGGGGTTTYALLHYSDGTTYLNASTGKNLYFRVSNSTKMIVKFDGNVGIGTVSPSEKLQVNGTVKATTFEGNGANLMNLSASRITSGTLNRDHLPKLFKMQSFNTVSTETTVNTNISSNTWEAAIIGFDSGQGDIYEGGEGLRKIMKMYMSKVSNKWVVNADFASHLNHETWTVYVMFIRKNLVE